MATAEQIKERGGKYKYGAINGEQFTRTDAEIEAWVDQELADEANPVGHWRALREQRNRKLAQSDWMANSDVTMSDEWKTYRQALRDFPSTLNNTTIQGDYTWPTEPS